MALNRLHRSGSAHLDPNNLGLSVCLDGLLDEAHPERTLEHIELVVRSVRGHVDAAHQQFMASSRPEDRGQVAASFSVFAHEVRHFHDLLLTCYGSFLLRQSLQLNMAYFNMLRDEIIYSCSSIYVPLSEWVGNYDLLAQCHPELSPPTERIGQFVREYADLQPLYATFEHGNLKHFPVTATTLLEGSAILAQEEYIRTHFGPPAVKDFWSLFDDDSRQHYFGALDAMMAVFGQKIPLDIQAFILFAALSGDYRCESGIAYSTPADVFVLLLGELKSKKVDIYSPGEVSAAINSCFEQFGWGHPVAAVERAHQENRELLVGYRKRYAGVDLHHSVASCLEGFENYCDVQAALLRWLRDEPRNFVDLRAYCRNLFSLPLPPIYLECTRGLPYTSTLMETFQLMSGTSVRVEELPAEVSGQFEEIHDGEGFLNLWNCISFRGSDASDGFLPTVNIAAWQEMCRWSSHSRFLLESNRNSFHQYEKDDQILGLSACGVSVIGAEGADETNSKPRPGTTMSELFDGTSVLRDAKKGKVLIDEDRRPEVKLLGDGNIGIEIPILLSKNPKRDK